MNLLRNTLKSNAAIQIYSYNCFSMMNAVTVQKFGPENVLEYQSNVKIPTASKSMVVIKVMSAGVNPVDTYIRQGAFGVLPELPFVPGKDGAGMVESVGEGVTKFKVGDRVFTCKRAPNQNGTYAEYSLSAEKDVFPLDCSLNFSEGAAIGIPYFTAYRALVIKAKCTAGERVLVHGASGAVGIAAVQIAKSKGLLVIGTAGTTDGIEMVKAAGADYVLCHTEKNYLEKVMEITDNKGVNIVIEMLANVNLEKDLDIMSPDGRLAIVGSRGSTKMDPRKTMSPELQILGVALYHSSEQEWKLTSEAILQGIRDGWVKPVIAKEYSLQNVQDAHRDIIHSSGAKGKLIITVQKA